MEKQMGSKGFLGEVFSFVLSCFQCRFLKRCAMLCFLKLYTYAQYLLISKHAMTCKIKIKEKI